ncbi:MAG TPA: hemolysin III family protein [Stellaceae bacterium]|jgi:hemolysin III
MSQPAMAFPRQRRAERLADLCVLGGGLGLGLVAAVVLVSAALGRGEPRILVGVGAYVAGLLAMLGCSLLYRGAIEPRRRQFFRRLDHAAIFALIAGTATPFALAHGGLRGIIVAAALWAMAAIGIVVKLRFPIGGIGRSVLVYLLLGWASLVALGPSVSHSTVVLVALGGALYSIGVWFLLWRRLPYRLAIWHAFVLAGAICHYAAIMNGIVGG